MPSTEHFKLCQGNYQLILNQGISLGKALGKEISTATPEESISAEHSTFCVLI
jgi:hypothetical protein